MLADSFNNYSQHTLDDAIAMITFACLEDISEVCGTVSYFLSHVSSTFSKYKKYQGITIFRSEQEVRIDVAVSLYYPTNLHYVCTKIQKLIKNEIESLIGIAVSSVNVTVDRVVIE